MEVGHKAARCGASRPPSPRVPAPSPGDFPPLPSKTLETFLPAPSPPPRGQLPPSSCVARVEVGGHDPGALMASLPSKLAIHFGGLASAYKVSSYPDTALAVFFPSWVVRETAVGHSPLWLDGISLRFSNWVEPAECARGHLHHKAWLRLVGWPLLCWSEGDVQAAVSCFGELCDVDEESTAMSGISSFRVQVRCSDVSAIPSALALWVEDRKFLIQVVVDSWEAAEPILLGEVTDRRLGPETLADQDKFLASLGPSAGSRRIPGQPCPSRSSGRVPPLGGEHEGQRASGSAPGTASAPIPHATCLPSRGIASGQSSTHDSSTSNLPGSLRGKTVDSLVPLAHPATLDSCLGATGVFPVSVGFSTSFLCPS